MNIKVKIKHSIQKCKTCEAMAQSCNAVPNCKDCKLLSGVWVDTVKNIFETMAVVVLDSGDVVNVPTRLISNAIIERYVEGAVKDE